MSIRLLLLAMTERGRMVIFLWGEGTVIDEIEQSQTNVALVPAAAGLGLGPAPSNNAEKEPLGPHDGAESIA